MISEIVLGVTAVSLLVFNAWSMRQHNKNTQDLIKAVLSKNVMEYTQATTTQPSEPTTLTEDDMVDVTDLDPSTFLKYANKGDEE